MKTSKLIGLFLAIFVLHSCSKKSAADFDSDFALFKDYISSFSSGFVSVKSDIRVQLAFNKSDWKPNQELDDNLFDISPSVSGKVVALSSNTIAFIPKEKLLTIVYVGYNPPVIPTVMNAIYNVGDSTNPKNIGGLIKTVPPNAIPTWCDANGISCYNSVPSLPTKPGVYIYCVKVNV